MDVEETIGMRIITEVGIGLEKGNIKGAVERMIEVAVVDLGQDQDQVLIERANIIKNDSNRYI